MCIKESNDCLLGFGVCGRCIYVGEVLYGYMDSNPDHNSGEHKDLSSALSHIEALQKQLAEKNAELSEVRRQEVVAQNQAAQLNDMNEKLREWIGLGNVPFPGSDVLKRMLELRAAIMAFSETALKAREPVVELTGDAAAEITSAAVAEVVG